MVAVTGRPSRPRAVAPNYIGPHVTFQPARRGDDATPWIDVHEHLADERHRLGDHGYEFVEVFGEQTRIPGDWSALLTGGYAIDDLVSAGLSADAARRFTADRPEPLEKWELIEPYLEAARFTGSVRAAELTTERHFGLRWARETCEEIDERCRELRRPGYYRDVLRGVANVERCQVNSLDVDPFCETEMPELFDQDISIAGLVRGEHPRAEELSGIDVSDRVHHFDRAACHPLGRDLGAHALARRPRLHAGAGEPERDQRRRVRQHYEPLGDRRRTRLRHKEEAKQHGALGATNDPSELLALVQEALVATPVGTG